MLRADQLDHLRHRAVRGRSGGTLRPSPPGWRAGWPSPPPAPAPAADRSALWPTASARTCGGRWRTRRARRPACSPGRPGSGRRPHALPSSPPGNRRARARPQRGPGRSGSARLAGIDIGSGGADVVVQLLAQVATVPPKISQPGFQPGLGHRLGHVGLGGSQRGGHRFQVAGQRLQPLGQRRIVALDIVAHIHRAEVGQWVALVRAQLLPVPQLGLDAEAPAARDRAPRRPPARAGPRGQPIQLVVQLGHPPCDRSAR